MNKSLLWTFVFILDLLLRSVVSIPRRVTWDSRSPGSALTDQVEKKIICLY